MKHKLNLSRLICVSLLIIVGLTGSIWAQSDPMWKVTFEKKVKWMKVAPTGHLIVSTDEGLVGIDPEYGGVLWKREDLKGLKDSPEKQFVSWLQEFVPFTPFAVVRIFSEAHKTFKHSGAPYWIHIVNVVNGEDLWTTEAMELKDIYGYILLPKIGGMFLYGLDKDKKKTAFVLELETGNVIWQKRDFFKKRDPAWFAMFPPEDIGFGPKASINGNQRPLFDTEETMITFMNKKAIRKFNAKTGELIWETEIKAKQPPALRNGYAPMLLNENNDVLYAACAKTVYALRTQDGSLLWEKSPKLKGGVSQMQLTPHGLVVKVTPVSDNRLKRFSKKSSFAALDPKSGEILWNVKLKQRTTNYVISEDEAIVYAFDGKLYAINLADGKYTIIAEDLKLEGKEVPRYLALRDDGYFLQTSNNVMLVSFFGEKVFHTNYKAPGRSLAGILAGEIVGVLLSYSEQEGWETDYDELRRNYPEWAPGLWDRRFKDTKNLETYTYILTEIETEKEKGVGLVKVNKTSGETEGQIVLGTKQPVYDVDEIEARLFFRSSEKEVVCLEF